MNKVTDELPDWQTYSSDEWPTLLTGNGLSINLWSGFDYASLFEEATRRRALSGAAEDIFDELSTTNFEAALECLHHARIVQSALGHSPSQIDDTYKQVRDALLAAVSGAHVEWLRVTHEKQEAIANAVREHTNVFTTNYDLCVYWAVLGSIVYTKDYFWNSGTKGHYFDPAMTSDSSGATLLHHLHGALHLWQDDATGVDGKWTNAEVGNLTDVLTRYTATATRHPLFVSEGTSESKVRTIRRSAYLSFCLDRLHDDDRDTVVFGHSLSSQDDHIINALRDGARKRIAVSMRPTSNSDALIASKSRIREVLNGHEILFFDSTTHPLGDKALTIRPLNIKTFGRP